MNIRSVVLRISLFLLLPSLLFSQGILTGTVTDSLSNELLIGANVFLRGTSLGSASDREGRFRITNAPVGTYTLRVSYVGYKAKEFQIDVTDQEVALGVKLAPDVLEGQEVVVTAQARGQVAAINQQITSNTIVNVVSQEKIRELPDANAAEAIGRLPGVSILRSGGEANKVILRGLEDKFTNITIDGVKIPATDATSRGVDLSMLSQSSLAGVELFKALTPDKDGDALAGSINLVTRKAPEGREIRADVKGDYNHLMRSPDQYDLALHYSERFLDDLIGVQLTGNLEKRIRSNERINVNYGVDYDIQGLPKYYVNDFLLEFTDETRKREGVSLLLDVATPDGGSVKISNVYGRTKREYLLSTRDYTSNGGGSQGGSPVFDYRTRDQDINTFSSSVRGDNTLLDLSLKWGVSFAQSGSDFPFDYEAIFVEPSGMDASPKFPSGPDKLIPYAVNNFANSSLYWAYFRQQDNYDKEKTAFLDVGKQYVLGDILSGEFKVGGKMKIKDRSNLRREDFTPYYLGKWKTHERLPDGTLRPKDFTGTYFEAWQNSGSGTFIGIKEFFSESLLKARHVYDSYFLNPLIAEQKLRQWRELNRYGVDVTGNEYEIWVNPLIRYDDYFVTERVTAAYAMNTLNIGQSLTVIAGARIEKETNDYRSTFMPAPVTGFPVQANTIRDTTSSFAQTLILPNLNISFRPVDFINIRLAAYKAIGRPDFNMRLNRYIAGRPAEASNTQFLLYVGNTALKTSSAWNYEVNASFFGNSFGLVSLSAYYKEIKDMYHMLNNFNTFGDTLMQRFGITWKSNMPTPTTPFNLTFPYNSPKPTKVWGFEFEHQMNFHFLPAPLNNLILSYNASIVDSKTIVYGSRTVQYVDSSGPFPLTKSKNILIETEQKLEGMPEFFGNIALGCDIGGFSARLSLFHKGKHNVSFSASGQGDRVTVAYTRVDLTVKQRITDYLAVFVSINNVTNIEEGTTIADRKYGLSLFDQSERYGLTGDFGVTIEL